LIRSVVQRCFLVVVVDHVHGQRLIGQPVSIISTVLGHLVDLKHFALRLIGLLGVDPLGRAL
jgi:hypothetical protein